MDEPQFFVGLDIGADYSTACLANSTGGVVAEQTLQTRFDQVSAFIASHAPKECVVVGMESGSGGILLARRLRASGYQVHIFAARQASRFLKIRQNKTDLNDARGIAELVRLGRGVVSEAFLKSPECQHLRTQLVLRQKLVQNRVAVESAINSAFRLNGGKLKKSWSAASLKRHVDAELERLREIEGVDLKQDIEPILTICLSMRRYLERLDRGLTKTAERIEVCSRFMQIPGIGPISALSFYSAIGDPHRFRRNEDVGAYLGLVPKIRQSGTVLQRRSITKMGNSLARAHLGIAAGTMLRLSKADCDLKTWALNAIPRIGKQKARTALSRKMAVVMIAMWRSNTSFVPDHNATPLG